MKTNKNRVIAPKAVQASIFDHCQVKKSLGTADFAFDKEDVNLDGKHDAAVGAKLNAKSRKSPSIRKSVISTNATSKNRAVKEIEINVKSKKNHEESDKGLGKFGFGKLSDDDANSSIVRRVARVSKKRNINEIS